MEGLDQVETKKILKKLQFYMAITSISLLRGIYIKDQEIINCSLIVLLSCGIFYSIASKED